MCGLCFQARVLDVGKALIGNMDMRLTMIESILALGQGSQDNYTEVIAVSFLMRLGNFTPGYIVMWMLLLIALAGQL
jgi:hypothetical protein